MSSPCIVWFRLDLRLRDNPALAAAVARGGPVISVYVLDEGDRHGSAPGGASRWWLHHSLTALERELMARGSRLIRRRGQAAAVVRALVRETGAEAVYWNRGYEPAVIARDKALKTELAADGLEVRSFNAALLFEPHTIANKQGKPFQVFTPFWRHCQAQAIEEPVALPERPWKAPARWPASDALESWSLLPRLPWDAGFREVWEPGEAGAERALQAFVRGPMESYDERRDYPGVAGTSRLSPHLHFGEVGPRQVWAAVKAVGARRGVFPPSNGARVFLSEVGWREFGYHLLYHFPDTVERPLRPEFERFPWRDDPGGRLFRAWRRGRTGYPIVDAGMRELWATGWLHNRVRMVAASFLVKHLRLPWQSGAAWFWDTLVDADLASNTLGWQWSAGCGADAAPYFRIFAPVLQGLKFDGNGDYVRRWVPELARLPDRHLQAPWEAPADVLAAAGVELGRTYPRPVVDHGEARNEALAAYQALKA